MIVIAVLYCHVAPYHPESTERDNVSMRHAAIHAIYHAAQEGIQKITKQISAPDSAASVVDYCRIRPRSSMDQAQMTVVSGLDDCRVCTQKRKSLDADFCDSRTAEEGSRQL